MGGYASKLEGMDWDLADGGITSPEGTIDGQSSPTEKYGEIYIEKKNLVNESEYAIKDGDGKVLYQTVHDPNARLREQFDLVLVDDADNKDKTKVLLQVYHRPTNRSIWDIYWVGKPTYEGQESEKVVSKTSDVERYKRACIVLDTDRSSANVHMFGAPKDKMGEAILHLERVKAVEGLASLGRMAGGGVTEAYQTMLPTKDGEEAPDQPLVGFWKWENIPLVSHKMHLTIAKGADLPLHAVLAIVCNIMRVDKWAGDD